MIARRRRRYCCCLIPGNRRSGDHGTSLRGAPSPPGFV